MPAPKSITLTSAPVTPIRPIGTDVNLTCTVELSPLVDIAVIVTTEWTGPVGFMTTNTAQPVMGSNTTYTSTANVSSFGREESGNYSCRAYVSSTTPFVTGTEEISRVAYITTGNNILYTFVEVNSLSWQVCIFLLMR